MELTKELNAKLLKAQNAEEIMAICKEAGEAVTEEEAKDAFAAITKSKELSDDDLDNIAGGWMSHPKYPAYDVGDTVYHFGGKYTVVSVSDKRIGGFLDKQYEYQCKSARDHSIKTFREFDITDEAPGMFD